MVDHEQGIGATLFHYARRAEDVLDSQALSDISEYIRSRQSRDGGFRGRSTESDLYYTFFAISCLLCLGEPVPGTRVQAFIDDCGPADDLDLMHQCCMARCNAILQFVKIPQFLAELSIRLLPKAFRPVSIPCVDEVARCTNQVEQMTIYDIFIATQVLEDYRRDSPKDEMVERIKACATQDGGYAKIPGIAEGTTTHTAAATMLLQLWGRGCRPETIDWLLERHCESGGFLASPLSPAPDLLSTATAVAALRTCGVSLDDIRKPSADFVNSLWAPSGGFKGSHNDPRSDCEYTFYALLTLGTLLG